MKKTTISVSQILKKNISYFRKSFSVNIGFEAVFKSLTSFIFLPFITMILNYFMHQRGFSAITNNQMLIFTGSLQGALTILILGVLTFVFIFMELGGLIVIAEEIYFDRKTSAKTAFFTAMKNIRGIMTIGFIPIFIYILVIIPFSSGMGLSLDLLSHIEIPSFILDVVFKSIKWTSLYILLLLIANYFLIRWIFSLHCVILEGKNFSAALKRSSQLVKDSFFKIAFSLLLWNLFMAMVTLLGTFLFIFIVMALSEVLQLNGYLFLTLLSFMTTIASIVILIGSLFITPLNIILITQLYYEQTKRKDGLEPKPIVITTKPGKQNWEALFNRHKKKLIATSILLMLGFSGLLYLYFNDTELSSNLKTITITAHRGDAAHAPDNTMSSLLGAIENKADYSELDVQETKDGVLVLTHDINLKENTGVDKNIWELTYEEVEKLEVGSHFSSKFAGEKIATLENIIKTANKKIKLNIEIKLNGHDKHLEESVVKLIENNDFVDQCVVTSLEYDALQKVKNLNPKIKTGYIIFVGMGDISSLNVDFFSVEATVATPEFIEKVHANHKAIHVWTINDTETMKKFIDLGVDSIITDDSKEAIKLLQQNQRPTTESPIDKALKLIQN